MSQDSLDSDIQNASVLRTAGQQLAAARQGMGLDLADVARSTRVPQRHLEAIEAGNYAALPSPTYATGFAKAYARAVDLDEVGIAAAVREELTATPGDGREWVPYETADPKRVPPKSLAWIGAVVAVAVIALFGWWYGTRDALPPETQAPQVAASDGPVAGAASGGAVPDASTAAAATPTTGVVELVATAPTWVRITAAGGERILEREMQAGERFAVPASADAPTIRTGRPEALDVLVGGRKVAPLGPAGRPVGGVVLTAAALAARPAPPADTTASAAPPRP